jgi:hypothetical protein
MENVLGIGSMKDTVLLPERLLALLVAYMSNLSLLSHISICIQVR